MRSATKITTRSLSSVAAKLPAAGLPPPSYIDLCDTRRLFTSALLLSLATLSVMAAGPLVDLAAAALRSSVPKERRLLRAAVLAAARVTVHRQFSLASRSRMPPARCARCGRTSGCAPSSTTGWRTPATPLPAITTLPGSSAQSTWPRRSRPPP